MPTPFTLLRLVGKELAKHAINTAAFGLPVGNVLVEVAEESMRGWKAQTREDQRRAEQAAMLRSEIQDIRKQVAEIIRDDLGALSPDAQQEMAAYLMRVSLNLRQRATQLAGAGGPGVVAPVALDSARDLASLLPDIPPSFRPSPCRALSEEEVKKLVARSHSLNGGIIVGLDGYVVEVQGQTMRGLPNPRPWRSAVDITGMARGAIGEAMDRISGAFTKLNIPGSPVEILVNLVPADLVKEGTWLDLPLAIIILQAAGFLPELPEHRQGNFILYGELDLRGDIRRVPGALAIAHTAKTGQQLIVPAGNERESALILARPEYKGCNVYGVSSLQEVIDFFLARRKLEHAVRSGVTFEQAIPRAIDFGAIRGQAQAKGAACIAAAGGHNLLLIGPPGEGKTLLASALPGILPPLTREEIVELTKIYSTCGELERDGVAVTRRPIRHIHSTTPKQALIGGGSKVPKPGEITLAHLGVLFLDEIPQFGAATLNALRQPMEDGEVTIARVGATITYPCRFTLVAAMNPCPCGWFATPKCSCKPADARKYQKKISGPIVDRIDLQVQMGALSPEDMFGESQPELSPKLRAQVQAARQRQQRRFAGTTIPFNAAIPADRIQELCNFSPDGFEFYKLTVGQHSLSMRSTHRLAKVARTVADLTGADHVTPAHVSEAAKFVIGGLLRE